MLAKKIREKGITNVAKELGITPQRVNNWVFRGSFPVHYIRGLARVLEISVTDVLADIEEKKGVKHETNKS